MPIPTMFPGMPLESASRAHCRCGTGSPVPDPNPHTRTGVRSGIMVGSLLVRVMFGVLGVALLAGCREGKSESDLKFIQMPQFRALVDESKLTPGLVLVADARTASEWAAGHVPGARNIRAESARLDSPDLARFAQFPTIVVYGTDPAHSGAKQLAKRLLDGTDSRILVYPGGMRAWRLSALPMELADGTIVAESAPETPAPPATTTVKEATPAR